TIEHSIDSTSPAWRSISAVPLNRAGGGAVITCSDITELRQAEIEAQRSHQALAHVARVSTVGEMTASITHQLAQPLTAILTNAQVAQRLIGSASVAQPPTSAMSVIRDSTPEGEDQLDENAGCRVPFSDLVELRAILGDIVTDDRRASDVIVKLRRLLQKGELDMSWLNLTGLIQEVVDLLRSEAIIRGVDIAVDVDQEPAMIR